MGSGSALAVTNEMSAFSSAMSKLLLGGRNCSAAILSPVDTMRFCRQAGKQQAAHARWLATQLQVLVNPTLPQTSLATCTAQPADLSVVCVHANGSWSYPFICGHRVHTAKPANNRRSGGCTATVAQNMQHQSALARAGTHKSPSCKNGSAAVGSPGATYNRLVVASACSKGRGSGSGRVGRWR